MVLAIGAGAVYTVHSLLPHKFDIAFDMAGDNSYGSLEYGFDNLLKTETDLGSGGNWGNTKNEKFTGTRRRAVMIYHVKYLTHYASCAIYQDGNIVDQQRVDRGSGATELTCSAVVG
ncbi:MAG: hypothetical protein JO191_14570 [Mycobacteriaceae bacterium]|nr:hypothetical protein [Mycobacteriaceae bacterium]